MLKGMTNEEMIRLMRLQLQETRGKALHAVGNAVVICLEGMGFCIVPAWMVQSLEKIIEKAKDAVEEPVSPRGDTNG